MLLALIIASVVLFLFLAGLYVAFVVETKAFELYEEWAVADAAEQDRLWYIIRGSNHRRRRIERILERERKRLRNQFMVNFRLGGEVLDLRKENKALTARNRVLAATVIESILEEEKKVADVLVDRLRRKGP